MVSTYAKGPRVTVVLRSGQLSKDAECILLGNNFCVAVMTNVMDQENNT